MHASMRTQQCVEWYFQTSSRPLGIIARSVGTHCHIVLLLFEMIDSVVGSYYFFGPLCSMFSSCKHPGTGLCETFCPGMACRTQLAVWSTSSSNSDRVGIMPLLTPCHPHPTRLRISRNLAATATVCAVASTGAWIPLVLEPP